MKQKIEGIYNALQKLDIKCTPNNVEILDAVYFHLREIYGELEAAENGTENGEAADPGGQDNH